MCKRKIHMQGMHMTCLESIKNHARRRVLERALGMKRVKCRFLVHTHQPHPFPFLSSTYPTYAHTDTPMSTSNGKIKLGQYNIIKTIGTGSFGKVKRNPWGDQRKWAWACEWALGLTFLCNSGGPCHYRAKGSTQVHQQEKDRQHGLGRTSETRDPIS